MSTKDQIFSSIVTAAPATGCNECWRPSGRTPGSDSRGPGVNPDEIRRHPEQYEKYKAAGSASLAAAGGRYLVRGGELVVLEGDWQPSRLVVLEFEDLAAARRWHESAAYQEAKKLREGAAHLRVVAVQGLD